MGVPGLGAIAFECSLLQGVRKLFDIYLLQWGLAVEVDGPQHFQGSYCDVPWEEQYHWDRHVDAVCRLEGQRLVRLHWQDRHEWASTVQRALASHDVVTYTSSYGL